MQIQISWLLQKPTDLDLHCLQRKAISGFSRSRVNYASSFYCLCLLSSNCLACISLGYKLDHKTFVYKQMRKIHLFLYYKFLYHLSWSFSFYCLCLLSSNCLACISLGYKLDHKTFVYKQMRKIHLFLYYKFLYHLSWSFTSV